MTRLMSVWTSAITPASRSVMPPSTAAVCSTAGASSNRTWVRTIRYTPAVTIVAAWMRALTGVGPSIASGSHVCSGTWADLATAPPSRPSAMSTATVLDCPIALGASEKTVAKSSAPVFWMMRKRASTNVASPKAFMMNAFFPACTAVARWCQKLISRYEERPTRPQPTSSRSRLPDWTSISIEKTKSAL